MSKVMSLKQECQNYHCQYTSKVRSLKRVCQNYHCQYLNRAVRLKQECQNDHCVHIQREESQTGVSELPPSVPIRAVRLKQEYQNYHCQYSSKVMSLKQECQLELPLSIHVQSEKSQTGVSELPLSVQSTRPK